MISARFGHVLDKPLAPILKHVGVNPNAITVAGFLATSIGAWLMAWDLKVGAGVVLFGCLFDILDGAVARVNDKATEFGAFLDSVLDRYADAFIFLGIAWHMTASGRGAGAVLSLAALVGAFGTSYARARAEGLGITCRAGILERGERLVLVLVGAFTGWMLPVLWVLAVLTNLTVVQRVLHVLRTPGLRT